MARPWDVRFNEADAKFLEKSLNSLPVLLAVRVRAEAMWAAAKVLENKAKARALTAFKQDTGELRASIRRVRRGGTVKDSDGKRKQVKNINVAVKVGGRYARQAVLVEYGHGGPQPAPPHPYLEPAALDSRAEAWAAARSAALAAFRTLGPKVKQSG